LTICRVVVRTRRVCYIHASRACHRASTNRKQVNVADAQEETKKQIGATQFKLAENQKQLEDLKSQLDELRVQRHQTELQYQKSLDKHPNGKGMCT